jgi:predicted MFS family arabinose efflux permease
LLRLMGGAPRLYRGWWIVAALGVTTCVSYGILLYGFAVFLGPMEAELGWTRTQLTGAFSLSCLVGGLAGVPVGLWVDRHGARGVMTAGSVAATALLLAWSQVERLASFYALWVGLGVAAAAVLYEPAFAVVAVWFDRKRGRALTLLTFLGGLASVIFVPLTQWLVAELGWRTALVWLAAIFGLVTIPLHAGVVRSHPARLGLRADGAPPSSSTGLGQPSRLRGGGGAVRHAIGQPSFQLLTAAFALSTIASTAMVVHLVPLLLEAGHTAAFAAAAMGVLGLMALPGRLVFTPLGGLFPRATVTAGLFVLQALASVPLLLGSSTAAVWCFAALLGAGFGAVTPARAALVAELYGTSDYGAISGVMAFLLAISRSVAPVGASVVHARGGGYAAVLWWALGASAMAAVLTLVAQRAATTGTAVAVPLPTA